MRVCVEGEGMQQWRKLGAIPQGAAHPARDGEGAALAAARPGLAQRACSLTRLLCVLCCAVQVALEEFADFENVHDVIYVRIANIPLQESIRDLRWGSCWAC